MRKLLVLLAVAAICAAQPRKVTDEEVMKVHKSAILIDTHNDITSNTVRGADIGPRSSSNHTDLVRLKEGGVGATFFAVYVAASYVNGNRSANRAMQMIDTIRHDIVGRYPNDFVLATTAADVEAAHKRGKFAALMGIEGGHAIEDNLRLLRQFYNLGIRYMTLTHSNTNNWADSSGDITNTNVKHHNGLTDFGKDVIREMNRLGMIVDISHVADKTFWDALEISRAPIFASHSSCRAISNIPRNMTDEMIKALAAKGGVIQINFGCNFLNPNAMGGGRGGDPRVTERLRQLSGDRELTTAERREMMRKIRAELGIQEVRATLADVVAHIDHVVKLAGIDAVGIGSDYDGVGCVPEGLDDVSKYPNLTRALLEKGYSAADIRKIYGGNTLRVMRGVEKTAKELQSASPAGASKAGSAN